MRARERKAGGRGAAAETVVLRLYVAGTAPNSLRAIANLRAVCEEYLAGRSHVEIVDALEEPLRTLDDGVLVTPTLLKLAPGPVRTLIGDLSDRASVLLAIGETEATR